MLIFKENHILQQLNGFEKNWPMAELLENPNPLAGEPLADRNEAMKRLLSMAEMAYSELSETAILRYDFWKQLLPQRIEEKKYNYSVKISDIYHWELTVNSEGLFYKDLTPMYSQMPGQVHEQLFSDFWFYGPLMPLPDLATRKWVVANIRNAFMQAGSPASYAHFKLFDYSAPLTNAQKWETGNHEAGTFVNLRQYGIEYGNHNWHDGLVHLTFLSFEQFLSRPDHASLIITPDIRTSIEQYLARITAPAPNPREGLQDNSESKRLFMDNGGRIHYIHLDGFGDVYNASAMEEAAWRAELIDKYTVRLRLEDNETVLGLVAQTLQYNGVENVSDLLCEAGKKALPKVQQSIAQLLIKQYDVEKGAEVLIALLDYEDEESYWRNYVFNMMFRMRDSRTVQQFIIGCLNGGNQTHFNKAVDVLQMWGILGDKPFTDKVLLNGLNWADACASDPNFHQTLKRVERIIRREF